MAITVYKVLNSDADEEENNVLINRVTEMYFKWWKIHKALHVYAVCSIREYRYNLAEI